MGLLSREHPKAQPGGWFLVVVFWRSPGSNLPPLVYKASDLTTAPRRLLALPTLELALDKQNLLKY